jgi:hypothetical protein
MIQVKEFLNYQEGQDYEINKWLKENDGKLEIIDIKYSVGVFQAESSNGYSAQEFSGALIIYKTK